MWKFSYQTFSVSGMVSTSYLVITEILLDYTYSRGSFEFLLTLNNFDSSAYSCTFSVI